MDVNGQDSSSSSSSTNNKSISKPFHKTIKPIKSFEWDNYLSFCNGIAAPAHCFNQNESIPSNEFRIHQKLEVTSPDNRDFIHLATVVGIMGPRLQLRLDGCDNSNDLFELVDSDVINPIGTCKRKNKYFAAPLRFRKDAAVYGSFCKQILKNAVYAPPECFKTPPTKPPKNCFEPGMKLEAVDIKHPSNICPATIKNVDYNDVEIHLDGWDSTNDYKCPYFSRNLFPVGWCKKSGLILQFPGKKAEYQEKSNQSDGSITIQNQETNPSSDNNSSDLHDDNDKSNENQFNNEAKTSSPPLSFTNNIDQSSLEGTMSNNYENTNVTTSSICNDNDINNSLIRSSTNNNNNTNSNSDTNHFQNVENRPNAVRVGNKRNFDQMNSNHIPDNVYRQQHQSTPSTPMNGLMNGRTTATTTTFSPMEEEYGPGLPKRTLVKKWSIDELMEFLHTLFSDTRRFEHNFRFQEIDGEAFLLLNNDLNMKYLNLKLGFSLKITDIIDRINSAAPY